MFFPPIPLATIPYLPRGIITIGKLVHDADRLYGGGLIDAYLASVIQPDPGWPKEPVMGLPFEPVEPIQSQQGWTVAILEALGKSAAFNAQAAKWTAWAVGLSSVSAVLGAVGSIAH